MELLKSMSIDKCKTLKTGCMFQWSWSWSWSWSSDHHDHDHDRDHQIIMIIIIIEWISRRRKSQNSQMRSENPGLELCQTYLSSSLWTNTKIQIQIQYKYKYWIHIQILIEAGWDQRIRGWINARHILSSSSFGNTTTSFSPLCFSPTQWRKQSHLPPSGTWPPYHYHHHLCQKQNSSFCVGLYIFHRHGRFSFPVSFSDVQMGVSLDEPYSYMSNVHWAYPCPKMSLFSHVRMGFSFLEPFQQTPPNLPYTRRRVPTDPCTHGPPCFQMSEWESL